MTNATQPYRAVTKTGAGDWSQPVWRKKENRQGRRGRQGQRDHREKDPC